MKKYWKLIMVTLLVVITLSTFYVNSSLTAMKYPEFVIKHKSGDEKEIENVSVSAGLIDGETEIYTEITPDGTNYLINPSYLYFINGLGQTNVIKRLQKEHRNFMRGKNDMETQYYEDENLLAYVNMRSDFGASGYGEWNYSFEIDVLDKSSNKTSAFKVAIPESERFDYVHVQRIQVSDGQIKVFAVNDITSLEGQSNVYQEELHLYSVSIKNEGLVHDDLIIGTEEIEADYSVSVNILNNSEINGPNKNSVYTVNISEEKMTDDGFGEYKIIEQQLIAYNLETNEQKKIKLPDEYGDNIHPEFLSHETIYFSHETEGKLEMVAYNIEGEKVEGKQMFDLSLVDTEELYNYTFKNDKIYLMQQHKVDTVIMIADIKTGDVLYEGSVEKLKEGKEKYSIGMNYLEIK